jgi:hypothetical protein
MFNWGFSRFQKFNRFLPALLILGLIIFGVFPKSRRINVDVEDTFMIINAPDSSVGYRVEYADILSITRADVFEKGSCASGTSNKTYSFGSWRNYEFGDYSLYIKNNIQRYIIVKTTYGVVVFNFESSDATDSFYTAIMELIQSSVAADKGS